MEHVTANSEEIQSDSNNADKAIIVDTQPFWKKLNTQKIAKVSLGVVAAVGLAAYFYDQGKIAGVKLIGKCTGWNDDNSEAVLFDGSDFWRWEVKTNTIDHLNDDEKI